MSLLIRALRYREKYLKNHIIGSCLGLFKRVISYLNSKNKKSIKTLNYLEITEKTLKELLDLPLDQHSSYQKLNNIISDNFNFIKSALLIFSPEKNKFTIISSTNLDDQTKSKLSFDIEYNNIFKKMIKDKSYVLYPDNKVFKKSEDIFSNNDLNDSDFQMFVPFIFSGHVVGIFLGLKLNSNYYLNNELITNIKKVCNATGNLLYNLIQNNNE